MAEPNRDPQGPEGPTPARARLHLPCACSQPGFAVARRPWALSRTAPGTSANLDRIARAAAGRGRWHRHPHRMLRNSASAWTHRRRKMKKCAPLCSGQRPTSRLGPAGRSSTPTASTISRSEVGFPGREVIHRSPGFEPFAQLAAPGLQAKRKNCQPDTQRPARHKRRLLGLALRCRGLPNTSAGRCRQKPQSNVFAGQWGVSNSCDARQ